MGISLKLPRPDSTFACLSQAHEKFGLNAEVPWLSGGALCFIWKENEHYVNDVLLECQGFRDNFESIWSNLRQNHRIFVDKQAQMCSH